MKQTFQSISMIIIMAVSICCGGCKDIEPLSPQALPFNGMPEAQISHVYAPIAVPLKDLMAVANREIPEILCSQSDKEIAPKTTLDLVARRSGEISMTTDEGFLNATVPVVISGQVKWNLCKTIRLFGKQEVCVKHDEEYTLDISVRLRSRLGLNSDWSVRVETTSEVAVDQAEISLGPLKIGLKKFAHQAIESELPRLNNEINQIIVKSLDVRGQVAKLWEKLGAPIRLSKLPPAFLQINPLSLRFAPAKSKDNELVFGVGIDANLKSQVGSEPPLQKLGNLPDLVVTPQLEEHFHINMPVALPYDAMTRLLQKKVMGKVYNVKDQAEITLTGLQIFGNGPYLMTKINFSADVSNQLFAMHGFIYLQGIPVYAANTQQITIEALSYDVNTRNLLGKFADWMLHDQFLQDIRQHFVFPLAGEIAKAKTKLQLELNTIKSEDLSIEGKIKTLIPQGIYPNKLGLNVLLEASGQMNATLKPTVFQ